MASSRFTFDNFLIVPLRVHLLSASNAPAWHTTLKESDITRILKKVNGIWSQAGIYFHVESVTREEANAQGQYELFQPQKNLQWLPRIRPEASCSERLLHVYYVKDLPVNGIHFMEGNFVKDTASLREVPGGIDEPLPRVTSHELGHALGLMHRQNETNLLASRTTGVSLNEEEIQRARDTAKGMTWVQSASAGPAGTEELRRFLKGIAEADLPHKRLQ